MLSVTLIIPAFNSENTIEKCVKSVLSGTCIPEKILIYDDCSIDDTPIILRRLSERYPCISVITGHQNKGAGHARNELFKLVKTPVTALLDADDYWYPDKLERQLELMKLEKADIVTCGYDIFEANELIGRRQPPRTITYRKMLITNWIPTSMTIFRTELIHNNSMPEIRLRQDYAFWLQTFKRHQNLKCISLSGSFGAYNRHDKNLSRKKLNNVRINFLMFRNTLRFSTLQSLVLTFANILIRLLRK